MGRGKRRDASEGILRSRQGEVGRGKGRDAEDQTRGSGKRGEGRDVEDETRRKWGEVRGKLSTDRSSL